MEYLIGGIGGILGSLTRYMLGQFITRKAKTFSYVSTLLINISGTFLMGVLNNLLLSDTLRTFIVSGYLGAYTTFSMFMYDGFVLFKDNTKLNALIYITASLILGITSFIIGAKISKLISI